MAPRHGNMVPNPDHDPSEIEELVIEIFEDEVDIRDESRMTPRLLQKRYVEVGMEGSVPRDSGGSMSQAPEKQRLNRALSQLTAAGWLRKVDHGLYEFVNDPRGEQYD